MVKSMYAAVAGLRAHQSRLDVISNNVANVNTWGYKAQSASFKESMYQTTTSGSGGTVTDGGYGATNPAMYGYGSLVSAISANFTQGSPAPTDRAMDLFIDGPAFFMVGPIYGDGDAKNPQDCYMSRVGDFEVRNGYLVDSNGRYVYGCAMSMGSDTRKIVQYDTKQTSTNVTKTNEYTRDTNIGNVTVETTKPATVTKIGDEDPNLGTYLGTDGTNYLFSKSVSIKEDAGNYYFSYNGKTGILATSAATNPPAENAPLNNVIKISVTNVDGNLKGNVNITYTNPPKEGDIYTTKDGTKGLIESGVTVEEDGKVTLKYKEIINENISYEAADIEGMDFSAESGGYTLSETDTLKPIKIPTICQYWDEDAGEWVTENNVTLDAFSVDRNGIMHGTSTKTKKTYTLGAIALVSVLNPNGMTKSDGPYYSLTDSAGTATVVPAGSDTTGQLTSGYLEMANVDIANEFSTMITAQRGFQANSKIITVTDEMLQELVNMKR